MSLSSELELLPQLQKFFFKFPNLFAACNDTFSYNQQMVWWVAKAGKESAL
jgi:hypothetical protein